ncbi:hypothetical protein [Ilumatobacter coccineus]|uniref:hypothetical protein n=1 Tax=Ilumatobacter coccineus TaxID=467094 RepID=UPI001E5A56D2|nr:hypothetical protein [Ilumatobacter coccineus]
MNKDPLDPQGLTASTAHPDRKVSKGLLDPQGLTASMVRLGRRDLLGRWGLLGRWVA